MVKKQLYTKVICWSVVNRLTAVGSWLGIVLIGKVLFEFNQLEIGGGNLGILFTGNYFLVMLILMFIVLWNALKERKVRYIKQ